MADTGYRFATSSEVSTGSWTNLGNFFATDGSEAACSIASKNVSSVARLLNFGFTTSVLPDTATITQVNLRAVWRVTSAGGVAILGVAVHHSSWGLLSTLKNTAEPTSLTTDTYDITAVTTWTPSVFRDNTLTVHVRPNNGNNATDPFYRFDSVSLDVIYTVPAAQARQFFRSIQNLDGIGSDGFVPGNQVE
jgi:hypothetical protein